MNFDAGHGWVDSQEETPMDLKDSMNSIRNNGHELKLRSFAAISNQVDISQIVLYKATDEGLHCEKHPNQDLTMGDVLTETVVALIILDEEVAKYSEIDEMNKVYWFVGNIFYSDKAKKTYKLSSGLYANCKSIEKVNLGKIERKFLLETMMTPDKVKIALYNKMLDRNRSLGEIRKDLDRNEFNLSTLILNACNITRRKLQEAFREITS